MVRFSTNNGAALIELVREAKPFDAYVCPWHALDDVLAIGSFRWDELKSLEIEKGSA
jgi:hypothetical protein